MTGVFLCSGSGRMSSREPVSTSEGVPSSLAQALDLMKTALQLLDEGRAPPDIGAHLDLAICRLSETLDRPWPNPVGTAQRND